MHLLLLVLLLVCAARARHEFSFENGEEHVAAVHPWGFSRGTLQALEIFQWDSHRWMPGNSAHWLARVPLSTLKQ